MISKLYAKIFAAFLIGCTLFSFSFITVKADGSLNGNGVSISEDDVSTDDSDIGDNSGTDGDAEDNVIELSAEPSEEVEGLVFDLDFSEPSEFRLVVGNECDVVSKITIKTTEEISGQVQISQSEENPTEIELDRVLGYCNIELKDIDENKVESVNWKLKVNREVLLEQDYKKDSVSLMLFQEEGWEKVATERKDGDSDNFFYFADTENFGGGHVAVVSSESTLFSARNILYCAGSLLGLVFLLVIGYLLMSQSEDKGKKKKK